MEVPQSAFSQAIQALEDSFPPLRLQAQTFLASQRPEVIQARQEKDELPKPLIRVPATEAEKQKLLASYESAKEEIHKHNPRLYTYLRTHVSRVAIVTKENLGILMKEIARSQGLPEPNTSNAVGFTVTTKDEKGKIQSIVVLASEKIKTKEEALMVLNHELRHVQQNTDRINAGQSIPDSATRERYAYSSTIKDLTKILSIWEKNGKAKASLDALRSAIQDQKNQLSSF